MEEAIKPFSYGFLPAPASVLVAQKTIESGDIPSIKAALDKLETWWDWSLIATYLNTNPRVFSTLLSQGVIDPFVFEGILFSYSQLRQVLLTNPTVLSSAITLSSEQDIINMTSTLVSKVGKDTVVFPIVHVYDYRVLLRYGYLPRKMTGNMLTRDIISYASGMTKANYLFWYGERAFQDMEALMDDVVWRYYTLDTHIKNGVDLAYSFPLLMYEDKKYTYPDSNRPRTGMTTFRQVASLGKVREGEQGIPVIRYSVGMSQGLYNRQSGKSFCGTFYYYQEGSSTLLSYKTSEMYTNKYEAAKFLDPEGKYTRREVSELEGDSVFLDFVNGVLPRDLMMTPTQVVQYYRGKGIKPAWVNTITEGVTEVPFYVGVKMGLYALEDDLDQGLCMMGKEQGIDLLIFTHMIGGFQVVQEVLDTRDRQYSFESLVYI